MEAILAITALVSLVALAGIIYPFTPFGKRRNAVFTFVVCFALIVGLASSIEQPDRSIVPNSKSTTDEVKAPSNLDVDSDEDTRFEARDAAQARVIEAVKTLQWTKAIEHYQAMMDEELLTDNFRNEIEASMLALVKPLPANQREMNLTGYQFLSAVRQGNTDYSSKVDSYQNAVETARNRAVSILRKNEDKVEGVVWYRHPNAPKYLNSRSTTYLYIGERVSGGRPWLRMKVQYTSSDWLFVKEVFAWHDGIKESFVTGRFDRDNNSTIWEWMDIAPDERQIEVLRSIGNAKEAILRFEGDQYRRDVTLSSGDKTAIREVLTAYEVMRSGGN